MPHLNDNELDRLSREAGDQFDVEPTTSNWDALQRRLDEELPQERRKRRLLIWWWLTGVLLLGGALWGFLNWNESRNEIVVKQELQKENITGRDNRNETKEGKSNQQLKNNHEAGSDENLVASGDEIKVTRPEASDRAQRNWISSGRRVKHKQVSINNFRKQNGNDKLLTGKPKPVFPETVPTKTEAAPYISEKQQQQSESVNSVSPAQKSSIQNSPAVPGNQPSPSTSVSDSTAKTATPTTQTTAKKQPLNPSSRRHSFYATLLAGADFSNVKFSSAGRTGFNGGLQIGFYLTNRLSINTGIVYNQKNYEARGKDFTPKGAMVYYDIDKIEGGCTMFDIPLNIRYDLGIKPRSRYFISTGISSYLMDTEDYDYYFYNNNGDYSNRNLKSGNNTSHLFSILNFSGGVEKQLGGKFRFMAEPYLKIPVTGLGTGSIRLNSFGINLGLKYQFSGNKKQ